MHKLKFNKRTLLRIFLLPLLLYSFYLAKLPTELIIFFGIFFVLIILFRTKAYEKIEFHLGERFPYIHEWPSWKKKLLIILVFILIYWIIKQILYFFLQVFFGIDVEEMLMQSLYSLEEIK